MAESNKQLTPIKVSETDQVSGSDLDNFWVLGFDKNNNKSAHATMSQLKGNMGDSAFQLWQKQPGNTGKTYEEYLAYNRQPATEAAAQANEQMSNIKKEADSVIKDATDAAKTANDAAENVQDGKTPVLASVNAQSGVTASGSFADDGVDELGNPKYILDLTLPKGQDGQPAIFEQGTTTTVDPDASASVDVLPNGETAEGNPKYILNFSIPRGQKGAPGEGAGNLLADVSAVTIGKKYLLSPIADGSSEVNMVEYTPPGNATSESAGLMTSDQFQKLEKLSPSYLSNDVTGKKLEYTDAGKLLFEGKETFAVDASNELTLAGKKLSDLGGGGVYELPSALMELDPSTATSDEIKIAIGGDEGFNSILQAASDKKMFVIETNRTRLVAIITTLDTSTEEISLGFVISFVSMSYNFTISKNSNNTYTLIVEVFNAAQLVSSSDTVFFKYSKNDGELMWNSHDADTDVGGTGPRYAAYSMNRNVKIENSGSGTKALMDDGTYKEIGGSSTQYLDLSPLLDAEGNIVEVTTDEFVAEIANAINKKIDSVYFGDICMPAVIQADSNGNYYIDSSANDISIQESKPDYTINSISIVIDYVKKVTFKTFNSDIKTSGNGTKFLSDDGTYKEVGGDYQLPAATSAALGGIKIGYVASEKNYPVQLDGSDKAYVNVPWTDTNTTYDLATTSANGLMSSTDKTKLDRIGSYTTATTVANLNANYENIEISNLSANASLSVNLVGTNYNGWDINVFIYCSSARTITIPTSGNYISMIGSSLSCPAGKWTELNLHCAGGKWRIAKLEQQ